MFYLPLPEKTMETLNEVGIDSNHILLLMDSLLNQIMSGVV